MPRRHVHAMTRNQNFHQQAESLGLAAPHVPSQNLTHSCVLIVASSHEKVDLQTLLAEIDEGIEQVKFDLYQYYQWLKKNRGLAND